MCQCGLLSVLYVSLQLFGQTQQYIVAFSLLNIELGNNNDVSVSNVNFTE